MTAITERYGQSTLLQFEDFANRNAQRLLDKTRDRFCTFNGFFFLILFFILLLLFILSLSLSLSLSRYSQGLFVPLHGVRYIFF